MLSRVWHFSQHLTRALLVCHKKENSLLSRISSSLCFLPPDCAWFDLQVATQHTYVGSFSLSPLFLDINILLSLLLLSLSTFDDHACALTAQLRSEICDPDSGGVANERREPGLPCVGNIRGALVARCPSILVFSFFLSFSIQRSPTPYHAALESHRVCALCFLLTLRSPQSLVANQFFSKISARGAIRHATALPFVIQALSASMSTFDKTYQATAVNVRHARRCSDIAPRSACRACRFTFF